MVYGKAPEDCKGNCVWRLHDYGVICGVLFGGIPFATWINTWLVSDNVQVAPQEVEVSSYLVGQIDAEVDTDDLSTAPADCPANFFKMIPVQQGSPTLFIFSLLCA